VAKALGCADGVIKIRGMGMPARSDRFLTIAYNSGASFSETGYERVILMAIESLKK
jgi:hypothetical protein